MALLLLLSSLSWSEPSPSSDQAFEDQVSALLGPAVATLSPSQKAGLIPVFKLFEDKSKEDLEKSKTALDALSQSLQTERETWGQEALILKVSLAGVSLVAIAEGVALILKR